MILRWLLSALSLLVVAFLLPHGFHFDSAWTALLVAAVLGLANIFVKPILVLLTLPVTLLTFGIFLFVINAVILLLVSGIVDGFMIDGFQTAFFAAVLLWIMGMLTARIPGIEETSK